MQVRAKEPCYVERQFHEAGEVFDWHNVNSEPLPACMERLEPSETHAETVPAETPEPAPQAIRKSPGRPRKQG